MNRKGFTLIELLLAVFLTALITGILSIAFNTGLRAYRQGKDLLDITRKGQMLLSQMTRELKSAVIGPNIIFKADGDEVLFMAPIADEDERLDICEAGYVFNSDDNEVVRHYYTYWNEDDSIKNANFNYPDNEVDYDTGAGKRTVFCSRVTDFNLRYYDGTQWLAEDSVWPDENELPVMIEVEVTIEGKYGNPNQSKTFTTWIYLPFSTNQ